MSQSKQAAKSVAIIIVISFSGKLLGFIREMLIGAKFGSGIETDTYFVALSAIALFTNVITRAINNTMIPILSEIEKNEGKVGKKLHTNNLLNIVSIISVLTMLLAYILAPNIIKIIAPGFETLEQFKFAILMMRIGIPSIFLSGIHGILSGYLQTENRFTESAAVSFPMNFIYIFFLIFLTSIFGLKGLMVTSVLAAVSQALVYIYGARKVNFRYEFIIDFKDKYVKRILNLIPPILISVGISDLNSIIDKALASTLIEGSISALNYAGRLNGLVGGIFISAITTVMYPMLSKEANEDDYDGLKRVIINGINIILLITIPATVGMIILAHPIVKIAFQRGAFDASATYMTVGALIFTLLGMVGISLKVLLNNAYYSLQDTKTLVINGFIAVAINISLNYILIKPMAHRGLALATSISATMSSILLIYGLKKKIGPFGFFKSVKCGLKSLVAAFIMGVVVYFLDKNINMGSGTLPELIALLCSASIGVLIYLILIYLFKVEEINWAIMAVKDKIKKTI